MSIFSKVLIFLIFLIFLNNAYAESPLCNGLSLFYDKSTMLIDKNKLKIAKGFEDISIIAYRDRDIELMENKIDVFFNRSGNNLSFCNSFSIKLGVDDIYYRKNDIIKYDDIFKPFFIVNMRKTAINSLKKKWEVSYKRKLDLIYKKKRNFKYINTCNKQAEFLSSFLLNEKRFGVGSKHFRNARNLYLKCLNMHQNRPEVLLNKREREDDGTFD